MAESFKSKISYGLLIPILILSLVPAVNIFFRDVTTTYLITVLVLVIVLVAAICNVFFGMRYNIVDDKNLIIKTGIFHKLKLEIIDIKTITKTSSILSAPAASFDRVEINYGKHNKVVVSPADKQGFVSELQKINPSIDVNLAELH